MGLTAEGEGFDAGYPTRVGWETPGLEELEL